MKTERHTFSLLVAATCHVNLKYMIVWWLARVPKQMPRVTICFARWKSLHTHLLVLVLCQNRRRKIGTEKTRKRMKKKKRVLTSACVSVCVKRCEILLSLPLLGQHALYLLTYMPETAIAIRHTRGLLIFFILIWWPHIVRNAFERETRLRRWKTWLQLLKTYDSW